MSRLDRGKLAHIEALLFIHDVAIAEGVGEAMHARFGGDSPTFVLEVLGAKAMAVKVSAARAERDELPVGCIVADEADALEMLRRGADEAVVMHEPVDPDIHVFVDRTLLRAGLRVERERELTEGGAGKP